MCAKNTYSPANAIISVSDVGASFGGCHSCTIDSLFCAIVAQPILQMQFRRHFCPCIEGFYKYIFLLLEHIIHLLWFVHLACILAKAIIWNQVSVTVERDLLRMPHCNIWFLIVPRPNRNHQLYVK